MERSRSHVVHFPSRSDLHSAEGFFATPPGIDRDTLQQSETFQQREAGARTYGEMVDYTTRKLAAIGLTVERYLSAYAALQQRDLVTLQQFSQDSLAIIKSREHPQTTAQKYKDPHTGEYSDERKKDHEKIITEMLASAKPSDTPQLLVLAGPMGAGKSRIRNDFLAHPDGAVRADPDELRHKLISDYDPLNYAHVLATNEEVFDLSDKIFDQAVAGNYRIVYEGTLRTPDMYEKAVQQCQDKEYSIDATYVYADLAECFRRTIAYRDRPVALHYLCTGTKGFEEFIRLFIKNHANATTVRVADNTTTQSEDLYRWRNGAVYWDVVGFDKRKKEYQQLAKM